MRARGGARVLMTVAALTLASCTSASPDGPTSPSTSTPEPSATEQAPGQPPSQAPVVEPGQGLPPFPSGTAVQFDPGSGAWDLLLHDVRVAAHDGYDRVVLEFTGAGVAGWSVQYVDRPRLDGSGTGVRLDGAAYLDIYASHTTWPVRHDYDGQRRVVPLGDSGVEEVYLGGWFEGYTQVIAGIDEGARPFRVFTLTEPARLVIDIVDG